jgi:predicted RND superfamily exporter protein
MMISGLIVSLLLTFLFFPAILILLPKEQLKTHKQPRFSFTLILAKFTDKREILIIIISFVVLVLSFIGITKLKVENSFINYFKKDSEIYQGLKLVDRSLGGTTPLDVILDFNNKDNSSNHHDADIEQDDFFDEFDELELAENEDQYWFTAQKIKDIKKVHNYLHDLPETGKVLSMASTISIAELLNKNKPLDSFELALLYNETPDKFKDLLLKPYVSVEHSQSRFWVRIIDSKEGIRRDQLLKTIRSDLTQKLGFKKENVHLAGMLVLYNNMLQSLFDSQAKTLAITTLILTLTFLLLFKSLKIALLAMIPNMLPISVVLGIMGWFNIPLDMMTITIAAIGIGIAVDDTIHYIHNFKMEISKDFNYKQTMYRCHSSIGYAMYYTTVTIIIGFSILAFSNFIPNIYFGLLTGLTMLVALIADLTLLPVLLIKFKPFGNNIR